MFIVFPFGVFAATLAVAGSAASALDRDYGYWQVNVTCGNAATGYRWGDVYAEYFETPGKISHMSWRYNPEQNNITITRDDPDFDSSVVDYQGDQGDTRPDQVSLSLLT